MDIICHEFTKHCVDGFEDLEVGLGQVNCSFQGQCTTDEKNVWWKQLKESDWTTVKFGYDLSTYVSTTKIIEWF